MHTAKQKYNTSMLPAYVECNAYVLCTFNQIAAHIMSPWKNEMSMATHVEEQQRQ